MKKALITGVTGQDGAYLSKFLIEKGLKLSDIIQYIRAMITGLDVSPRIYDIMEILGFVEIKKRIESFING